MRLTVDQFGTALVTSGLMTADEVKSLWNAISADARPKHGDGFAKLLIEQGKLNPFQADELLSGRPTPLALGDYVLLDKIGEGGMGQVFKAQHRRMNRMVAIKLMSAAAMKDANAVKRFQREVHAAARLEHPNIVTAYDSGEAGNVKYLVMQFVDGGDLTSLIKQKGPLEIEQAVDFILQAARGLAFAHGEGVVHRDIKPANLLLDKKGIVKILDMGLARIDGGEGLTATDQVMGTVDYMSPEQATNTKSADARSDIYSLGCTLWYLLTAKKVYEGEAMVSRLMAHRNDPLPSLVKTRDDVPWSLEQALHKMIAKQPQQRFQTMDEVVAALEPFAPSGGSRSGMGSGIGAGPQNNAEMASFLKSVSPAVKPLPKSPSKPAPTKAKAPVEATAQFIKAEADTDPKNVPVVDPLNRFAASIGVAPPPPKSTKETLPPPPPANGKWTAAGAGGATFLILLGIGYLFRDRPENELAPPPTHEEESVAIATPTPLPQPPLPTPQPPRRIPTTPTATINHLLEFGPTPTDAEIAVDNFDYDPAKPLTVEAFVTPRDTAGRSALGFIFNGGIRATYGNSWQINFNRDGRGITAGSQSVVVPNRRLHFAGVKTDFEVRLYLDGKVIERKAWSGGTVGRFTRLQLGRSLIGTLDEIRISQTARYDANFTPAERHEPDADTLALYHCDEGSGTQLLDSSGNNRHGKITGAKWIKVDGTTSSPPAAATGSK